jgi:CBS domain-containing protein/anti-sigma regulatory factor (Ser/Thr protein kinase)
MSPENETRENTITDQMAGNITRVEELAYELTIAEVMTREAKVFTPEMKMTDVLDVFRKYHISGAPIVQNNRLVGVISIEDLIRCLSQQDTESPLSKYMTSSPITIKQNEPVIEGVKMFVATQIGRLMVVDDQGMLQGILTKGDITRGVLKALQRDYVTEEIKRYRASHLFEDIQSDRSSLILRYNIKPNDFVHGGSASSNIKRALNRLGAFPQITRRCSIAIYEAEMNLIIHATHGGIIRVEIEPKQINLDIYDDGPGIEDINLAMKPGYSTATEKIREMGFGAGMGLVNISRCVDSMKLESVVGKGTRLKMKILMNQEGVGEKLSTERGI